MDEDYFSVSVDAATDSIMRSSVFAPSRGDSQAEFVRPEVDKCDKMIERYSRRRRTNWKLIAYWQNKRSTSAL